MDSTRCRPIFADGLSFEFFATPSTEIQLPPKFCIAKPAFKVWRTHTKIKSPHLTVRTLEYILTNDTLFIGTLYKTYALGDNERPHAW